MTDACPKCGGTVGHWDAQEDPYCINCGWRPDQPVLELGLTRDVQTPVRRTKRTRQDAHH